MGLGFSGALVLLLALPVLLWMVWSGARRREHLAQAFHATPPARWRGPARMVLVAVFLGSIAIAAAKPFVWSGKGGDFLLVTDVSRSMEARYSCAEPTFLDRAKTTMRRIIDELPEGRFAIVAADRLTFPISPLTYDRAYLDEVIENGLFVGMTYEATGTDLGNALATVAQKKRDLPDVYGGVNQIVLLSDGHVEGDYARSLRGPLEALNDQGIRVVAVAVGNRSETPIVGGGRERCSDVYLASGGRRVTIPMRTDILQHIAEQTGGLLATEAGVDEIVAFLRAEGLTEIGAEGVGRQRRDVSPVFVALATVGFLGLVLLQADLRSAIHRRRRSMT